MTKEQYDKIVEPDAPFEEIEKKPKTIDKYVEDVCGYALRHKDNTNLWCGGYGNSGGCVCCV